MSLFSRLISHARAALADEPLTLIQSGMSPACAYGVLEGESGRALGVALSPLGEGPLGPLPETLPAILEQARTYDPYPRALALAVMNGISRYHLMRESRVTFPDLRQLLAEKILEATTPQSRIVVIGHLRPVVERLKREGRNVAVFCRQQRDPKAGIYNDIFEYEAAQEADILLITGAALIGSTPDALLALSPKAKLRILAGFSAGVHPAWLQGSGITHVATMALETAAAERLIRNDWEHLFSYPACWLEVPRD